MTLSLHGNDVWLGWERGTDAVMTNLYTGTLTPNLNPGQIPWRTLGETATVHENGLAGSARYYALAGRDECGGESSAVTRAGLFPFTLVPGD